jgi:hypothetical protein
MTAIHPKPVLKAFRVKKSHVFTLFLLL